MNSYRRALFLPLLALSANAASNACRGTCTHEILASRDQAAASVTISGPSHLVSDLTSAANWEMLDCPKAWPEKESADVRLVCTAKDPASSCAHVTEQGAVNTIVRLPAECGTGPFARIAAWDVAENQDIPAAFASAHGLAAGAEVVQATLDYKFALIPEGRGTVSFDVRAAHDPEIRKRMNTARDVPGLLQEVQVKRDVYTTAAPTPTHGFHRTAYLAAPTGMTEDLSFPSIDLPSIALPSVDLPSISLPSLPSIDLPSVDLPSITIPDIPIPTISLPDFPAGVEKSDGFHALDLQKNVSLLSTSLGCHVGKISFDASADVSADVDMKVNAGYAFKIAGQLTPPKVTEFALAGVMSGQIKSTFAVDLYVEGDLILPPIKLLDLGIPGLDIPGIAKLGPSMEVNVYVSLSLDIAISASIPVTWDFERLDFVFPPELASPNNGVGAESKNTHNMSISASPGDITGDIGLHIMPKLEFGVDVLSGLASAEVYVGVDVDATYNANGTIYEDFSMDGCQDLSVGAVVKAGATAGLFSIFNTGTFYPIYEKRTTVWSKCSNSTDGPASVIYDNGDGTYTNGLGDLVNEDGELIDDTGAVIPDQDADDLPVPIKDTDGEVIPDDEAIIDNGDGTYEDAQGNPTNEAGERIAPSGEVLGCDLDTTGLVDATGAVIAPEEAIFDMGDGTYSNVNGSLVNEDGQLIDPDGNIIDFEPILDDTGAEIPLDQVVLDNGDGTYSDAYGNPVDQYGGAIDVDDDGNVIPVAIAPFPDEDTTQEPADEDVDTDPDSILYTPDQLKSMAEDLLNGINTNPPAPTTSGSSTVTASGSTSATESGSTTVTESGSTSVTESTTSTVTASGTTTTSVSTDSVPSSSAPVTTSTGVSTTSAPATLPTGTGADTCNLDNGEPVLDEDGNVIPTDEVIYDLGNGTYSNAFCELVNAEGQLIDANGNVIEVDTPSGGAVYDNGDGTYSDADGNPVDANGNPLPATATATPIAHAPGTIQPPVIDPTPPMVSKRATVPRFSRRATSSLEKRGFGCYAPSLSGMNLGPVFALEQLTQFL